MEDFLHFREAPCYFDVQEDIVARNTVSSISNQSQTPQTIDTEDKTGRGIPVQGTISYVHTQNSIK